MFSQNVYIIMANDWNVRYKYAKEIKFYSIQIYGDNTERNF